MFGFFRAPDQISYSRVCTLLECRTFMLTCPKWMQQGLFARFSRCFAFEHAFPCFRRAYNFRHVCRPHNEQYLHFFTRHITSEFSSVDVIRRAQTSINSFDKFNNIYQFIENLFLKTDTYHDERNMHERNNIHSHIVTLYNCFDN